MGRMVRAVGVAAVGGVLLLAGCTGSKQGSGEDKRVRIEAPGVEVDDELSASDSGMPVYPGARENRNGKDKARVNLSLPFVKLKIVKLKFTSDDAPAKVVAFYRDKLGSYGAVLECKGGGQDVDVGGGHGLDSPVKCDKVFGNRYETTLKVGTEGNEHAVQVRPEGKGSEFTLVYIQLRKGAGDGDFGGKEPS